MGDISLDDLFPACVRPEGGIRNAIWYIQNLCVSDVVDVKSNNKFVGGMVESLSRASLPAIKGHTPVYVAYRDSQISCWIKGSENDLPNDLSFERQKTVLSLRTVRKVPGITFDILQFFNVGEEGFAGTNVAPISVLDVGYGTGF